MRRSYGEPRAAGTQLSAAASMRSLTGTRYELTGAGEKDLVYFG